MRFFKRKDLGLPPSTLEEAERANSEADQRLEAVHRRWPEVRSLASRLDRQLEVNHFADRFRQALGG